LLGKVDDEGIAKRAVRHLFDLLDESHQNIFRVSYMEIYLEKLRDLLHKDGSAKLEITKRGEAVKNLSEHIVTSPKDIFCLMEQGERERHYGMTKMNAHSSRSHTVLRVVVESNEGGSRTKVAHLNIVDLAGSK